MSFLFDSGRETKQAYYLCLGHKVRPANMVAGSVTGNKLNTYLMESEKMTKEELANILNNKKLHTDSLDDTISLARGDLVVLMGYSDDEMHFKGAINNGVGCYDGGIAYLNSSGLILNECVEDDCLYFKKLQEQAVKIEALWSKEDDYSWTYKTDIPHASFDIIEEHRGEISKYCRGIVFNLSDVKAGNKKIEKIVKLEKMVDAAHEIIEQLYSSGELSSQREKIVQDYFKGDNLNFTL